ncbi:MAG: cytochrome c maturation protein CcmE [Gammaproteobacteria bacterium]|nr:MAG: cytochrome c maturation protein CcmE [Gammaproteobacteria bacterium]
MTPARKKRLMLVGLMIFGVGVAVALALRAFNSNLMFFYSPTQVVAGEPPKGALFRVGGMVVKGSIQRPGGGMTVRFALTDNRNTITVQYTGILPDLFREGQGIVAKGRLRPDGVFVADEVLAKHDENYMPPEVAGILKKPKGMRTGP